MLQRGQKYAPRTESKVRRREKVENRARECRCCGMSNLRFVPRPRHAATTQRSKGEMDRRSAVTRSKQNPIPPAHQRLPPIFRE